MNVIKKHQPQIKELIIKEEIVNVHILTQIKIKPIVNKLIQLKVQPTLNLA
jgi:hypothetical protein